MHNCIKMEADGIVPDTVDEAPSAKLTVIYPGGVEVNFGGELTPTQVKDQPEVKWDADPEKYYVLAMVDPDAPSRKDPKFREVNHWLVGNIKGSDVSTGDVIAEYRPSGPPKGTGLHRYIFLVYEQKKKLTFDEPRTIRTSPSNRKNFSVRKFVNKYDLGKAFAGNFYQAQWDPYVEFWNLACMFKINHWLVVNIKGNDVSTGEKIASYVGSMPRNNTGLHRYIFLVFEQTGRLKFEEVEKPPTRDQRRGFSIRSFAKKYNLGKAVAGNYYQAQWNPYINHWLVGNIKSSQISTGETLTPYSGSKPGKDSGLHRYIFLVFEQPGKVSFEEANDPLADVHRLSFSVKRFSKKYNLGKPLAGNYFQAEWEPKL
ncbi:hypothetical protein NQ315_005478 [Exocentrus adspersus]|uniref:Uncharacterized protein n=1 Tax=Exocentrus adspersus TaxID=1586481 RepID=A0AAV8VSS2_9CUCU|nr:hypothetical protein NQ315_005478 [Exocentrus adspersus]